MIALRVYCVPNSKFSIAAVCDAENLTHNSCILSTTMGFQCVDALPLMAWASDGKRCSRKPLQRLSSTALLIRVAGAHRTGNGS
jgi:hypothetical protein